MLKDNRDAFEDNEDVDLTGMIHQYNEDNELRRKINELKKQKEEGQKQPTPNFDPTDTAFMNRVEKKDTSIPDIRVDHDLEKTRVGFQDDNDKTLVIMDRKQRVDADRNPSYEATMDEEESFDTLKEEDLKASIKSRKEAMYEEDKEQDDEKTTKINKIITYTILGVLALVVLVGAGFGIKYMFFNGSSDDKKVTDKKETTNKKDKTDKDKEDTDITDNSAIIKQLETQITAYEDQLADIENRLTTVNNELEAAKASLANIKTLESEFYAASTEYNNAKTAVTNAEKAKDTNCAVDMNSTACTTAMDDYNNSKLAEKNAEYKANTKNDLYSTEYNKTQQYKDAQAKADEEIASLKQQRTQVQKDKAEAETKLQTYKNS